MWLVHELQLPIVHESLLIVCAYFRLGIHILGCLGGPRHFKSTFVFYTYTYVLLAILPTMTLTKSSLQAHRRWRLALDEKDVIHALVLLLKTLWVDLPLISTSWYPGVGHIGHNLLIVVQRSLTCHLLSGWNLLKDDMIIEYRWRCIQSYSNICICTPPHCTRGF